MNSQEWNPGQLLELSGYYWKTCTLHAGVKLDVFTAIGKEGFRAEDLARKLSVDARALTMLLNALTAMNLLSKSAEIYANTPAGLVFLSQDSPQYLGFMIMHHHHLVESWSQLDEAVRSGKAVRGRISFGDEEKRESFLMGMFNIAMTVAPELTKTLDLAGRRRFLDVGGGPGTYAIHFCLNNPELHGTIYDLPTTRPFAEKTVAKFGLSGRIDFMAGDYLAEAIAGTYDVAWLSQILHGENPVACQQIVNKTVAALEPGGLIMIHEFILENTMAAPLFPALFSLNMLLGTDGGQAYSEAQLMAMLNNAGVGDIRRHPFRGTNDSGIIMGVVKR
jgi:predicted O-methyltransferase YrrM